MQKLIDNIDLKVYSEEINHKWNEDEFTTKINLMPTFIKDRIMAYKHWQERQLRISGKLLLMQLITDFGLDYNLNQIQFTSNNRPCFTTDFDFSTTHSGNKVVCAVIIKGIIGVDLEEIKPININDYEEYFTKEEFELIDKKEQSLNQFYKLWTRKEALAKVIGVGLLQHLKDINVINSCVKINKQIFFFNEINVDTNYSASLVITK